MSLRPARKRVGYVLAGRRPYHRQARRVQGLQARLIAVQVTTDAERDCSEHEAAPSVV